MMAHYSAQKQVNSKFSKIVEWMAASKVDMDAVVNATQEMISLYEVWEQYNERACKEAIGKFMQGMGK
jgi:cyclin-C